MIVLDASCALKLILKQGGPDLPRRVLSAEVHAPYLLDIEVLSALRRLIRLKELNSERAAAGLNWLFDLGIEHHHSEEIAWRAFALRDSCRPTTLPTWLSPSFSKHLCSPPMAVSPERTAITQRSS